MKFLRLSTIVFFLLTLVSFAGAQETTPKEPVPLGNADVVQMVKAGFSSELVIAKIKASKVNFDTSAPTLTALKTDGVPDGVLVAMVQKSTVINTEDSTKPNPELDAQRAVVKALRKLSAATDIGISYANYMPLLAQVKAEVEDVLPATKNGNFMASTEMCLLQYQTAAAIWQLYWRDDTIYSKKIINTAVEDYGVKRQKAIKRDDFLSAIWTKARTHFNDVNALLLEAQRAATKDSK